MPQTRDRAPISLRRESGFFSERPSKAPGDPGAQLPPLVLYSFAAAFTFAAAARATYFDAGRVVLEHTDEIGYLLSGLRRMEAAWNIYSFPLHCLTYALTSFFEPDPIRIYQLNGLVPFFLMVFLLLCLSIQRTGGLLVGIALATPLLLSREIGLAAWPHSNQTACIVVLLGVLLLRPGARFAHVNLHFVVVFFSAAFARSEFALALYALLAITASWLLGWYWHRRDARGWFDRFAVLIALSGLAAAAMTLILGKPVLRDKYRSLNAFSQHFAYGLSQRTSIEQEPWSQHVEVFQRHFGEATTILGALAANPGAFFQHIGFNLLQLAKWVASADVVAALTCLALAGACSVFAFRIGRRIANFARHGVTARAELAKISVLAAVLPSLILVVLIYPRTNYLQMVYVLLATAFIYCLPAFSVPEILRHALSSGATLVVALLVLIGIEVLPARADPVRNLVETVRSTLGTREHAQPWKALSTDPLCSFVHRLCDDVDLRTLAAAKLGRELEDPSTRLILMSSSMLRLVPRETAQVLAAFVGADAAKHGWTAVPDLPQGWTAYRRASAFAAVPTPSGGSAPSDHVVEDVREQH